MKKAITIRIPEPCHEDWNKMTPTEQGKHCKVCVKEVFDFTNSTDEELIKKIYNNENLCGRFKSTQLNREMKLERKSGLSLAPLAASFLLPFTLLASNKATPNSKENKFQGSYASLNIGSLYRTNFEKAQIITTGKIIDENGKSISNVTIEVKESGKLELSGLNGDFRIASANNETLVIKKKGFKTQEIKLDRKSSFFSIELEYDIIELLSGYLGKIAIEENIEKVKEDSTSKTKQDSTKISIQGTVIDNSGLPLPGVNIIVKGTTIGTQTDFDGNYSIEAGQNQVLVFSYVGFLTKELTLSNIDNVLDLQMSEYEAFLGGMIVITGGISSDYSNEIMGYKNSSYDPEPAPWRKKIQTALANEKKFSKIKRARKKEAKAAKRNNKK